MMLIRFSFANFKSVGMDPVTLDMVSSAKIRSLPGHVCASSVGAKILRNAVVYGANAAGKSTLTQALSFMKKAIRKGFLPQSGKQSFCKCGHGYEDEETTFDIQFQIEGRTYDYGFSCILSKLKITSEWLFALGTKTEILFEREGSKVDYSGLESDASDDDKKRLSIYRDDFTQEVEESMRPTFFLTFMGRGRSFGSESPLAVFRKVMGWFEKGVEVIDTRLFTSSSEFYADGRTLDQVAEVLSSFDTGISRLEKQKIEFEDLRKYVPDDIARAVKDILEANRPENENSKFVMTVRSHDCFLGVEQVGTNEPVVTILKVKHDGSEWAFDFREESDGTRRLFDLVDLLFTESKNKVFVVDELSRSFHPMVTQYFVKLFNEVHADDDCQLIFTTHENDIMDFRYFRRDEIWFVERDAAGFTRLFPLDDFASSDARSDARLNKKYLEGRYGGVPVLSGMKALSALGVDGAI